MTVFPSGQRRHGRDPDIPSVQNAPVCAGKQREASVWAINGQRWSGGLTTQLPGACTRPARALMRNSKSE